MVANAEGRIERARKYLHSPEFAKLWRYASISVFSTVLTLVLLYLFFNVAGVEATFANLLATSITSVPAYYLNRTWAWGKTGKSHLMREVVPFWVISIVSILLSTAAVHFGSIVAHHLTHSHALITLVVLLANFFTYAVLWVVKFILFNRLLFKKPSDVDDQGIEDPKGEYASRPAPNTSGPIVSSQAFSAS